MGARQHLQRAVLSRGLGERDPGRYLLMRIKAEIGAVLVPGHIGAVLAALGEDRCAEQHDVGPDQVFEHVEDRRAAAELDQPRHRQMALDLQAAIGAFAHLGFVGRDPRGAIGRLPGIHGAQRRQPPVARESGKSAHRSASLPLNVSPSSARLGHGQ